MAGTAGNDTLIGGSGADSLDALAGDDLVFAGAGNDTILGGSGNDTIRADYGPVNQIVNSSFDTGTGWSTSGTGYTSDGRYIADADYSASTLTYGTTLSGLSLGPGSNGAAQVVFDLAWNDGTPALSSGYATFEMQIDGVVYARVTTPDGDGSQATVTYLNGATGTITTIAEGSAIGASGYQTLTVNLPSGVPDSGTLRFVVDATSGMDDFSLDNVQVITCVEIGSGDDVIDGGTGNDVIDAGAGNDSVIGGAGADSILLGAGNDSLTVSGADSLGDTIDGGSGDDLIVLGGGGSNDIVYGDTGNDTLITAYDLTGGNDTLFGGDGRDIFIAGAGDSVIGGEGGEDFDTLDLSTIPVGATVTLSGSGSGSASYGGFSLDFTEIEAITGTDFADTVNGAADSGGMVYATGAGNDTVTGGSGADTVLAGLGDDVVLGDGGADSLSGEDGHDTLDGGDGNDTLIGGSGNDYLAGQAGDDLIDGGLGDDTVLAGIGNDSVLGGDDSDWLSGNEGNDTLLGDAGNDRLFGDGDDDVVQGGIGDDTLEGGDGNDLVQGGEGNDSLDGNDGNDTLEGGAGQDIIESGLGDDLVDGGDDADFLHGREGNDTLIGGGGADTLTGGTGADLFLVEGADRITDFDALTNSANDDETDNDVVDLSGFYNETSLDAWNAANPGQTYLNPLAWLKADQADGVLDQAGGVELYSPDGAPVTAADLSGENTRVLCFTRDTRILTRSGARPIETLRAGDLVVTADRGAQPIRWIGCFRLDPVQLAAAPKLRPVRIAAGMLGRGLPLRDLVVSPQHRVLVQSPIARRLAGTQDVLVAAHLLAGLPGISLDTRVQSVEYWHLLLDRHEVIFAEGAPSESLYVGSETIEAFGQEVRAEILGLVPATPSPARALVVGRLGRQLAARHARNGKPLLCESHPSTRRSRLKR